MKFVKSILLLLFLSTLLLGQFSIPSTTRIRFVAPKTEQINEWRRSWDVMFALRPMYQSGSFWSMVGMEYSVITNGSYTLESRSFTTSSGHVGFATGFSLGWYPDWRGNEIRDQYRLNIGFAWRRAMMFANDVPIGEENWELRRIVLDYLAANPGSRTLYYNQPGAIAFFEAPSFKAEVFFHLPLTVEPVTVIPKLRSGETHVAIGLVVFELAGPYNSIIKLDWTVHSPGASYEKARPFRDGSGGVTLRQSLLKGLAVEGGFKREIGPTGFFRNDYVFTGIRFDFFNGF